MMPLYFWQVDQDKDTFVFVALKQGAFYSMGLLTYLPLRLAGRSTRQQKAK